MDEVRQMVTSRDGTRIAVRVVGPERATTLVLVHGFPDTCAVFDEVVARLSPRFRIVRYDVRGFGDSGRPEAQAAYELDRLVDDAEAVFDATCRGTRPHLVGHDWGSIQAWEIAFRLGHRVASLMSISGPCLDHAGLVLRMAGRDPVARALAAEQLVRSWYTALLGQPFIAARIANERFRARFAADLVRDEGLSPAAAEPASTFLDDVRHGANLYGANIAARLRAPRDRPIHLPVTLLVPTRDRFVSAGFGQVVHRFAPRAVVERLDAGHWCVRSRPDDVTKAIEAHVARAERAPAAA